MKLKLLSIIMACSLCQSIFAQSPIFDLSATVNYIPSTNSTQVFEFTALSYNQITDSTATRSTFARMQETIQTYNQELSYELMAGMRLKLNDKINLNLGLGVNSLSFKVESEFTPLVQGTLISTDTVSFTPSTSPTSTSFCDEYINNFNDIGSVESGIAYDFINLRIPLELSIALLEEKLRLNLGGYLQTPLFTRSYREYIGLNRELIDGLHYCEYERVEDIDKSGNFINNLQYGYSISAEYYLRKKIAVTLGAIRDLGNIFYLDDTNQSFTSSNDLQTTRYNVGVKYILNPQSDTIEIKQ